MTYILKSNQTVEDAHGNFPYITPFGVTNKLVKAYYENTKKIGFNISELEFNALHKITTAFIEEGVIDCIKEFYPLLGVDAQSVGTKLITSNNIVHMPIRGVLDTTNFDGKGLFYPQYKSNGGGAFDTGMSVNDIMSGGGFGITAYIKNTYIESASYRNLIAASKLIISADGGLPHIAFSNNNLTFYNKVMNVNPSSVIINMYEPGIRSGVTLWDSSLNTVKREHRWMGSVVNSDTERHQINTPTFNNNFYLGGSSVEGGNVPYYCFYGHIRAVAVYNGKYDSAKVQVVERLIADFITDLGKDVF